MTNLINDSSYFDLIGVNRILLIDCIHQTNDQFAELLLFN